LLQLKQYPARVGPIAALETPSLRAPCSYAWLFIVKDNGLTSEADAFGERLDLVLRIGNQLIAGHAVYHDTDATNLEWNKGERRLPFGVPT